MDFWIGVNLTSFIMRIRAMAKFDLSKKKAKKSDNSEKPRKRKVKRRKKSTATKEERKQLNLELIPVSEKWPPEENIQIFQL